MCCWLVGCGHTKSKQTVSQLAEVGCRALWLDYGPRLKEPEVDCTSGVPATKISEEISDEFSSRGTTPSLQDGEIKTPFERNPGGGGEEDRLRRKGEGRALMVFDVKDACGAGVVDPSEFLLR